MTFSDEIVNKAWKDSGGVCECTRKTHDHIGRCSKELVVLLLLIIVIKRLQLKVLNIVLLSILTG